MSGENASSDDDKQQFFNSELFFILRKKLGEKQIIEELKQILKNGADINAKNNKGKTVLHITVEKQYEEVLLFLVSLDNQIDIEAVNDDDMTPLQLADYLRYDKIVEILENKRSADNLVYTGSNVDDNNIKDFPSTSSKRKSDDVLDSLSNKKKFIVPPDIQHLNYSADSSVGSKRKTKNLYVAKKRNRFLDHLEIPSEGSKLAQHGNIFQLKLLMLFLWRAKENGFKAFRLATELSEAEKFDDVTFQYQKNIREKWKFRLLQAKHKEAIDGKSLPVITEKDLLSTDDADAFSLQKYFRSYIKIRERSKEVSVYSVFSDSDIEDVIVITNTDIATSLKTIFQVDDSLETDPLIQVINTPNLKPQLASIYKIVNISSNQLVKKCLPIFESSSDFYKLVEEVVDVLVWDKQIDKAGVMKEYYYPLINEVFEIKREGSEYYAELQTNNMTDCLNTIVKEVAFINNYQRQIAMSDAFGKGELPNKDADVEKLAGTLADNIESKLLGSVFGQNSYGLAAKVIDCTNKKFKSSFIQPKKERKEENLKALRDRLKRKLKVTNEQLKNIQLNVDEDFVESSLPPDEEKLEKLACSLSQTLKTLNKNQELSPLISAELEKYHVVLANEVFDVSTKTFQQLFIYGKLKEGKSIKKELSNVAKQFRRMLINHLISDQELQETNEELANRKIKISSGFFNEFKPEDDPNIEDVFNFAQEICDLISNSQNDKVIKISNSVVVKNFEIFKSNLLKLAGYVLVSKCNKIRFSTRFLYCDILPGNLSTFKTELRKSLSDSFDSLYEFELQMEIEEFNFKTCEDESLNKKLPNLHNFDDVKEFFSKLKFLVNYPNRLEINELLETEIQDKLKKLDSKAFNSLYQDDMHNWMSNRIGTFLTAEKAEILFKEINTNLALWIAEGVHKTNFAAIPDGYRFENCNDFIDFLESEKRVFNFIVEDLQFGRIVITQTFKYLQDNDSIELKSYTRGFGHIFLNLEQLLKEDFRTEILQYIKYSTTLSLIVIICDVKEQNENLEEVFLTLLNFIKNCGKVFLISLFDGVLGSKFETDYRTMDKYSKQTNEFFFKNLTEASQTQILQSEITFQGMNLKLEDILNCKYADDVIDSDTISRVINKSDLEIGKDLPVSRGYNKYYYIDRSIDTSVYISAQASKDAQNDMFVETEEEFDLFCQQHPTKNIHWVEKKSLILVWQKTRGSISKLLEHRIKIKNSNLIITTKEDDFVNCENRIVVISDTAGMGKTTLLTSLSKKMKIAFTDIWMVRIDLNLCTGVLYKELQKRKQGRFVSSDNAPAFLKQLLEGCDAMHFETEFEENLFLHAINDTGKIMLFFDGFDEISPTYGDIVIELIKALGESKVKRFFITTRPNIKDELERKLNVFTFTLEAFSECDQVDFLMKFWMRKLNKMNLNEAIVIRLRKYVDCLIQRLSKSISDRERNFTAVPLQIMMVAKIFQKTHKNDKWESYYEFLLSREIEPKLPDKLDLIDLYEMFIKRKYRVYRKEKKRENFANLAVKQDSKVLYNIYCKEHCRLALYSIFSEEDLKLILDPETYYNRTVNKIQSFIDNTTKGQERRGIIDQIIQNRPHFIHRTFAEYFIAKFISKSFSSKNHNFTREKFVLNTLLIKFDYEVIRSFINGFLEKHRLINHGGYGETIEHVCEKNPNDLCGDNHCSFLHRAILENNQGIVTFFLNCLDERPNIMQILMRISDDTNRPPLHLAAFHDNLDIIKILTEKGCDVNLLNSHQSTILHLASTYSYAEMVEWLVTPKFQGGAGAEVNLKDEDEESPLFKASDKSSMKVTELLIKYGSNLNETSSTNTVIHNSIHSPVALEMVNLLIKAGANIDITDDDGNSLLHYAAYTGKLEVAKLLVKNGLRTSLTANDGSTLLHEAACSGNKTFCEWLLNECHLDPNISDEKGRTALHEAAEKDNLEVLQLLVEHGGDVNKTTNSGNSVLFEAAKYGSPKLCQWLKEANIEICEDANGMTMLHIATRHGNLELVKWLLDEGLDPNAKDNNGNIVITELSKHLLLLNEERHSYKFDELVWKKESLDKNAYIRDDMHSPQDTDIEILKLLISRQVNINGTDKNGRTLLHYAAERNQADVVKWLITPRDKGGGGCNCTIKDDNQDTALDLALKVNDEDIIEMLQKTIGISNQAEQNH